MHRTLAAHAHSPREATRSIFNRSARVALIALLVLSFARIDPIAVSGSPSGFYVESTGQVLAEPFLRFWVQHDGERVLGLPVSAVVDRNGRSTQYFQYGVLVLKRNQSVLRLKAGEDLLSELRHEPTTVGDRRTPSSRNIQGVSEPDFVRQTNTAGRAAAPPIAPDILPFWQQWGGEELLGAPISPAYRQGARRTQWFEFGRIDLGAGGAVLAEIGLELAWHSGIPTNPADRENRPLFDPRRFAGFMGDGVVPNAESPFDPVRLEIPRIKVDAAIEITGVHNGVMTNPVDPWKAGWYASFARPGEWTNVVIAGHRDWWGYGPVVFWNLGYLQAGDKIYLLGGDGTGATYVVGSVTVVPQDVDPQLVINDVGYEALTLISCGGAWTGTEYTSRIIVLAYRI